MPRYLTPLNLICQASHLKPIHGLTSLLLKSMSDQQAVKEAVTPPPFLSGIKFEHLVAGLTGGVAATLITHPFDLLKLRFAVHDGVDKVGRPKYRGVIHAVRSVIRQDGVLGLYRGANAHMVGSGLSWGLYFFFYNALKYHVQEGDVNQPLSAVTHLLCASLCGSVILTMTNPIWVVKTRLCLKDTDSVPEHMRYKGLRDGLVSLYRHEGLRGCYKGYFPGLLGVSHGALQFMFYEELKKFYCNYYQLALTTKLGLLEYVSMAAMSKVVAATITYPFLVLRARLQDQDQRYKSTLDTAKRIIRNEGLKGFYKGLSPNLMKVVPSTCITFLVYENLSALLLGYPR